MTTEGHNKTLGIMYLAYGALNGLTMLLLGLFFLIFVPVVRPGMHSHGGMPLGIYIAFMTFIAIFGLLSTVPLVTAGYALLKRKPWARIAGIIGAVVAALNFPAGSALSIYTFWFLFGDGARLYDKSALRSHERFSLRDGSPSSFDFNRSSGEKREHEYVPPPQMPNWR